MSTPNVFRVGRNRPEWWNRAACRGMGDELFFDPYDEPRPSGTISLAKTICQQCVVTDCREYALRQGEPYGIWGGSPSMSGLLLGVALCVTPASTASDT